MSALCFLRPWGDSLGWQDGVSHLSHQVWCPAGHKRALRQTRSHPSMRDRTKWATLPRALGFQRKPHGEEMLAQGTSHQWWTLEPTASAYQGRIFAGGLSWCPSNHRENLSSGVLGCEYVRELWITQIKREPARRTLGVSDVVVSWGTGRSPWRC